LVYYFEKTYLCLFEISGGWDFRWDEDSKPGFVILEVSIPKHLDSSLIDVDVHPNYISIVIKSKLLRLRLPAEVKAGESKCQRSKASGGLVVTMPMLKPEENAISLRANMRAKEKNEPTATLTTSNSNSRTSIKSKGNPSTAGSSRTIYKGPKKLSLQEEMLAAATAAADSGNVVVESSAVQINSIVKHVEKPKTIAMGMGTTVFDENLNSKVAASTGGGVSLIQEISSTKNDASTL
jgi:hypothetical protein